MARGRRKKVDGVRSAYEFNATQNVSKCKFCGYEVPGVHLGNLRQHLMQHHADAFTELISENELDIEHEPPSKKKKISVEYDALEVEEAWLDLVVKEGRPFKILDSVALRKLLLPVFDALEINMLTSHNVHLPIQNRSKAVMQTIKVQLANKIFSLKIDSATRHTRRIICLNAQLIMKGKIKVYTLGMAEMGIGSGRHTSKNIKLFVLYILQKYDFSLRQIYSITQDNGRNFILAGKMLSFEKFVLRTSSESEHTSSDNETTRASDTGTDDEDNNMLDDANEEADEVLDESGDEDESLIEEESEDEYVDEDEDYDRIERENVDDVNGVEVVKCAAHTLALGVTDTVAKVAMTKKFQKFRRLAKFLRKPTENILLKRENLSLPKIDVKPRWNSSYDLIESVMKLQSHCDSRNIKILSANDWEFGQKFLKIFKPAKVATKRLQEEQMTLSDFFEIWSDVTIRVKKMSESEPMAVELYKNLLKREAELFTDNKGLQAALYLDPRFRQLYVKMKPQYFTDERVAQIHLLDMYKQWKEVQPSVPTPASPVSQTDTPTIESDDGRNLLEDFMREMFDELDDGLPEIMEDDETVWDIISSYNDRQPLKTNVLDYWYNKRFSHPILYKLACIVLAVPATQVSVERCFSVLKFVLSDYRARIKADILESIMLIKLN